MDGQLKLLHVRMPERLIRAVDERVAGRGISRTEFIVRATEAFLRSESAAEDVEATYGALRSDPVGEWTTAESAARWLDRIRHGDADVRPWRT